MEKKFLLSKMFTNKVFLINLSIVIVSLTIFLGTSYVVLELGATKYADRSKPKQYLHDINVSGKSKEDVAALLPKAFESYLQEKTVIDFGNSNTVSIQNSALEPVLDSEATLSHIAYYNGKPTFWQYFKDIVVSEDKNLIIDFDPAKVVSTIDTYSDTVKLSADATFSVDRLGNTFIIAEMHGQGVDQNKLLNKLKNREKTIRVKLFADQAQITKQDLEPYKATYQKLIDSPLVLESDGLQFLLNFSKNPDLLKLDFEQETPTFIVNKVELARFVSENLSDPLETAPQNIEITLEAGRGKIAGNSQPGTKIDLSLLEDALNKNLKNTTTNIIEIPLVSVSPTLEISEELQTRGIKELHTSIYTTFNGSTANRIHNITVGATKYNGLIIKQGETFSFNANLGEVDAVNGFLPELVIKSEGTVPEFGGGLCQVSSTLYRAALFAGLKITERSPHSYAVGYYAQVLGPGLDATIYPGVKDLKFVNDTPGDLLIESFVEGTKITFNFYGTKDARTVKVEGPVVGEKSSTNQSVYVVKHDLPPGTIKQVEKATPGFKTSWTRTVTYPNGETINEDIFSNYRTVANKYLVSPDKDPNLSQVSTTPLAPLDENGIPRI